MNSLNQRHSAKNTMKFAKFKIQYLLVILTITAFSNCTLEKQLIGSWQITSFEEKSVSQESTSATNIGTMTFLNNGSGTNNIKFRVLGEESVTKNAFTWQIGDDIISLVSEEETPLSKTWIITDSGMKKQVWKSTDNQGNVQILELEKSN